MKKMTVLPGLIVLSLCLRQALLADGAEMEILLIPGQKVGGELLVVREHSLLLSLWKGATKEQLQASNAALVEVSTAAIESVTLRREGGGYAAVGALTGCVIGGGIGYLVSKPSENEEPVGQIVEATFSPLTTVACALLGAGLGALVGSAIREDKTVGASSGDPDFVSLNEYARFQSGEPEFLRDKAVKLFGQ